MMSAIPNQLSLAPKVQYFEGLEGMLRTIDIRSQNDETSYVLSGHNNMHPKVREYYENSYIPKASKHKNKKKIIINDGKPARDYIKKAKDVYDEIIFVDPKKHKMTLTSVVQGNTTILMSYDPQDMSAIVIENRLIAEHMRTMFDMIKESSK